MKGILKSKIFFIGLFLFIFLINAAQATEYRQCTRVVDGDTIILDRNERVRLIGVDTPETVYPSKPVEFFGKEASAFTKRMVQGKKVRLEYDWQRKDKYGRTLAYIYLSDGTFLNAEIIKQGYGHAYTKYPFKYLEDFRKYERESREKRRGLWADDPVASTERLAQGEGNKSPPGQILPNVAPQKSEAVTVYVTRTGAKYHREGCRYLRRSSIPISLEEAKKRYSPCSVCSPPQ
ncbi:MAG: thermonuclease family protein [Thermodesulfobacteriota bacterium]|jgi:micrococcal nuclease|nr:MAG: thermonuclease family protein [Thermodesulfobacteriota bacterium]